MGGMPHIYADLVVYKNVSRIRVAEDIIFPLVTRILPRDYTSNPVQKIVKTKNALAVLVGGTYAGGVS